MQSKGRVGVVSLGWLGESLASFLLTHGYSVWGTTRTSEKAEKIKKTGIDAMLWESSSPISASIQKEIEASDILILNLPPSVFSDISYASGLSSFAQHLSHEGKLMVTSSTGVYPNHLEDAREDYRFKPEESNDLLEAEKVLKQQVNNRLCIVRLAGLIGEDRNPVHYLAKKEINDNPNKKVNLIHRKDILKIMLKIIEDNHFGEVINVCHPDHPTRKEYYSKVAQQFKIGPIHFTDDSDVSQQKIVNCRKLQEELNYTQFEML